ncbi:cytochrome c550 [Bacillus andreraoultii]|uniref:cytochrome c550 n=1 Tax=Bacillus andreraoultii TaxID=1499685 RepID=UPI00053ABD8B|nr:cytochrome c [Bacillus andreraoultii]
MKRNAVFPYLLIMVFGIGLIVALSIIGVNDSKEAGGEESKKESTAEAGSPEEIYAQNCISCHGENYEGAMGPELKNVGERLSADEIKDVLQNGRGAMPKGLVPAESIDAMTEWLSSLK